MRGWILNPIMSVITVNTNELNIAIKRASEKNLQVISSLIVKDLMLSSDFIYFKLMFTQSIHKKVSQESPGCLSK